MKPKVVRIHQLKPGDRFSFIPAAWHGPCVCRESYGTRTLLPDCGWTSDMPKFGKKRVDGVWTIKFDNDKVVNPPGVTYNNPETRVKLLGRKRGKIQP